MLNKLLQEQIRKHFGDPNAVPGQLADFLNSVSDTYDTYKRSSEASEAESGLYKLFDNIDEVLFSVEMNPRRLIFMSAASEKVYGYKPGEFYANEALWQQVVYPEDRQIMQQHVQDLRQGAPVFNRYRIVHKNGSIRWIQNKILPVLDSAGKLIRLDGVTTDVTEKIAHERKIERAEKMMSEAQRLTHFGTWEVDLVEDDLGNNPLFWSDEVYKIFGLPDDKKDISAQEFYKLVHPEDLQKVKDAFEEGLSQDFYTVEYRILQPDGSMRWLQQEASVSGATDQSPAKMSGTVQDITEWKLAESFLLQSEANLSAVIENTDAYVYSLDTEFRYVIFNSLLKDAMLRDYGIEISPGMLIYEFLRQLDPREAEWWEQTYQKVLTGASVQFVKEYRHGGVSSYVNFFINPMHNDGQIIGLSCYARDITEQKRIEESLQRSEANFRTMLQNTDSAYLLIDTNLNIVSFNQKVETFAERSLEKVPSEGACVIDFFPDNRKEILKDMMLNIFNGESQQYKYQVGYLDKKDLTTTWYDVHLFGVLDNEKNVSAIMMSLVDISERKAFEDKIRLSEERYRLVSENAALGISWRTIDGRMLNANNAFCDMLGYTHAELMRVHFSRYTYPEDMEQEMAYIHKMLDGEIDRYQMEKRFITKSGSVIWAEVSSSCAKNEAGEVQFLIVLAQDITSRKMAEEELHKSEANLRNILENTDTAYVLLDRQANILSYNSLAKDLAGLEPGNSVETGINYIDLMPEPRKEIVRQAISQVLDTEKALSYEVKYPVPGGDAIWIFISMHPILNAQREVLGLSVAATDITDRKRTELERETMTSDIIQRNKDLEQFAYIISHNLRSPVANILGLSNIIRTMPGLSKAEFDKCLDGLFSSVKKLDEVIVDLNFILQVRREINEKKEVVHFSKIIEDVKASIDNLVKKEKVTIITDFSEIDHFFTLKSYLNSIFYNLVSNSIKYRIPDVSPVISIVSHKLEHKIQVVYKDNGLGIDMSSHADKVFGLYKKFHMHTEGKGMGLYMVKTQVEILGGKISLKSEVNKGVEFLIEFSLADS